MVVWFVKASVFHSAHSANGGSNPIEVWCINRSELEMSCCKFQNCRAPLWRFMMHDSMLAVNNNGNCKSLTITVVRPRSVPALELISRAASSVGVMYRLQRSQHREQSRRRADKKINNKKINPRSFSKLFRVMLIKHSLFWKKLKNYLSVQLWWLGGRAFAS